MTRAVLVTCAGCRTAAVTVNPGPDLVDVLGSDLRIGPHQSDLHAGLWVEQLDVTATFDGLVEVIATDGESAAAVRQNPLYRTLSSSRPGASEFTILERMTQLRADMLHAVADHLAVVVSPTP